MRLRGTYTKTHIKSGAVSGIRDKTNLATIGSTGVAALEWVLYARVPVEVWCRSRASLGSFWISIKGTKVEGPTVVKVSSEDDLRIVCWTHEATRRWAGQTSSVIFNTLKGD